MNQNTGSHPVSAVGRCRASSQRGVVAAVLCLLLVQWMPCSGDETTAKSFHDRVVDMVTLRDGTRLFGFAVSERPVTLLVRTKWLEQQAPEKLRAEVEKQLQQPADNQPDMPDLAALLQQEIDSLAASPEPDQPRLALLREFQTQQSLNNTSTPRLLLLEIPGERLRRTDRQPQNRRNLGRLALLNHVEGYENLAAAEVARQLQEIPEEQRILTASEGSAPEDQLRTLLAAVDIQLNSAARLIRTGESIIDENAAVPVTDIAAKVIGTQLQSLLGDLLSEGSQGHEKTDPRELPKAAAELAERQQRSTIVLSDFSVNPEAGTATVTRTVFSRHRDQGWSAVLSVSGISDSSQVDRSRIDAILADPRIRQLNDALSGLGATADQWTRAIELGAVVESAGRKAESGFQSAILKILEGHSISEAARPGKVQLEASGSR